MSYKYAVGDYFIFENIIFTIAGKIIAIEKKGNIVFFKYNVIYRNPGDIGSNPSGFQEFSIMHDESIIYKNLDELMVELL